MDLKLAETLYHALGNMRFEANIMLREAYFNNLLGDKQKALEIYSQVLAFQQRIDDKRGAAITSLGIGYAYLTLGNFQSSFEYYSKALLLYRLLADKLGEAFALMGSGYSEFMQGQGHKGLAKYEQAMMFCLEVNDSGCISSALLDLTTIKFQLSGEKASLDNYVNVFLPAKDNGDKRLESALNNIGVVYLHRNETQKAIDYFSRSLLISNQIGNKDGEVLTLRNLMICWALLNNGRLATFYGKQSVNEAQKLRGTISGLDDQTKTAYLNTVEPSYRILANLLVAGGRIAEAERVLSMLKEEEYVEFLRSDKTVASKMAATIPLTPQEQTAFDEYTKHADTLTALGKEYGELQAESKRFEVGRFPKQRRLDELEMLMADAMRDFNKFLDGLKASFGYNDIRVAAVESGSQALLKELNQPKTVMISTIAGDDRLNIIVTTADTQRAHTINIRATDLNKLVVEFRSDVRNPHIDPRTSGKKMYDVLFPPSLLKDLEGVQADTIVWSLDGTLRYVPISALWDGKQYLVEKYKNVLITLASRDKLTSGAADRSKWQALGVGVSKQSTVKDLDGTSHTFDALSSVPDELCSVIADPGEKQRCSSINDRNKGVIAGKSLLDDKFTLESFKGYLGRYPVVHIASHFSLNAGNENDSFLLLGGGEERKLTLADVRQGGARFVDVDLLTLSACNTAMGTGSASNGVEVESFGALAQNQGAKAVVASLWSVADSSTRDLMISFYSQLEAMPRVSKAQALQKAQLSLLNGAYSPGESPKWLRGSDPINIGDDAASKPFQTDPKAPFAHPYYWSPFILMGNWQ